MPGKKRFWDEAEILKKCERKSLFYLDKIRFFQSGYPSILLIVRLTIIICISK
jgi:hypothetical protein